MFLESIGFEKIPETATEVEEEVNDEFGDLEEEFQADVKSIEELKIDQDEAARIMAQANKEAAERIKKQEEELKRTMASVSIEDTTEEIEDNAREMASAVGVASMGAALVASQIDESTEIVRVPVTDGSISWEIENPNEIMIEKLERSRLSSEADAIIAECHEHLCALRVEEVGRTLLAKDEFRGGYTVVGEFDGGPFTAGVMFPESENDKILAFKIGSTINCVGKIVKWSSGRREAVLKGRDPILR